jgi:N-acetylmuramoyl-L-alanine amidase
VAAAIVPGLPPVPVVQGAPIDLKVRYPSDNQLLATRDSNFMLGSVGTGDASLSINGVAVPVAPNGAFLGWVVNPPTAAPRYDLVVVRGADTVRKSLRVRYAGRTPLLANGKLLLDSASMLPSARTRLRPDELVRVSVRAPSNAQLWLMDSGGARRPLVPLARIQATSLQAAAGKIDPIAPMPGVANGASASLSASTSLATNPAAVTTPAAAGAAAAPSVTEDVGVTFATDAPARKLAAGARLLAVRGTDSVRLNLPIVQLVDPAARTLGVLRSTSTIGSDTDRVVNARTIPDGTYKWLLLSGTVVEITGKQNGSTRIQLDPSLNVWVADEDIVALPEGSAMPRRVTGGLRVTPAAEYVDLTIPLGERPAFLVEPDGKSMVLTLYGVQANPEISPIIGNDTLIRRISWDQVASDRVRITLSLSRPAFGWLSLWDEARRAFVLRVRRIPFIDPARPLDGLTIAVDPGHPPAGATGPTGLYEGDAVLPVGKLVADLLREKGAKPVLTRTTLAPVGLTERGVTSRRADAHAFVSIHLNALPDGVNPFTANGTSTLFYHQTSELLARFVERELVARFGLRDLGVHYQNLAVARPSWYPAVLTEGLFVMLPEQEAAMRDPAFQRRYAEAIVAGLEAYFRELSQQ